ncbi:MAG TPA: hypothetical protein VKA67_03885 [Verrucomicrobiae bacterium]|nr:hypothetical protein [Verrucomicrobiae bacterium]
MPSTNVAIIGAMSAEDFVNMLEEMIDLKVQQRTEMNFKTTPEIARVLQDKRETDRRRLAQIKAELVQLLNR